MLRLAPILLASAILYGQAPATGSFDMTVETTAGAPVAGATVRVQGSGDRIYSGITAPDGHFRLTDLPAGTYSFRAFDAPGYVRDSRNFLAEFSIHAGQTRTYNFQLRPAGKVEGTVTDDRGNPIAGVTVIAERADARRGDETWRTATTDSRGSYSLDYAADPASFVGPFGSTRPIPITVKAYVPPERAVAGVGYYPSVSPVVTIQPGRIEAIDFALRSAPVFHVRGRAGNLRPDAERPTVWISVCSGPEEETRTVRASLRDDGSFDAAGLLPGVYCVAVENSERLSSPLIVKVSDQDVDAVELTAP